MLEKTMKDNHKTVELHLKYMSEKIYENAESHDKVTKAQFEGINRNFLILSVVVCLAMGFMAYKNSTTVAKQTVKPAMVCAEVYKHQDNSLKCLRWYGEH